jgi:hypothetical protein
MVAAQRQQDPVRCHGLPVRHLHHLEHEAKQRPSARCHHEDTPQARLRRASCATMAAMWMMMPPSTLNACLSRPEPYTDMIPAVQHQAAAAVRLCSSWNPPMHAASPKYLPAPASSSELKWLPQRATASKLYIMQLHFLHVSNVTGAWQAPVLGELHQALS